MNKKYIRVIILFLIFCLLPPYISAQTNKDFQKITGRAMALAESSGDDQINMYWLFLGENSRASQPVVLTEKARKRRAKVDPVGLLIDEKDFPISDDILEQIKSTGVEIRNVSRWLNAVSVDAVKPQLMPLASLSEVKRIDLVEILKSTPPDVTVEKKYDISPYSADDLKYGYSLFQNQFINAIKLHQIGYTGHGIMMALFDSGFDFDLKIGLRRRPESFSTSPSLFLADLKSLGHGFSQAVVVPGSGCIHDRVHFHRIGFFIGETVFIDIGFHDLTDDQIMTTQIYGVNHLALEDEGAFPNERRRLEGTVEHVKELRFVFILAGIDPAIIDLFDDIKGGNIDGKCPVLLDAFQGIPPLSQCD